MTVVSTRLSLQWPPKPSFENTDTLVLVSNGSNFTDVRLLKDYKTSVTDKTVDWAITGKEHLVQESPVIKIEFQHEINTHVKGNTGGPFDTGAFVDQDDGTRLETGVMENLETGNIEEYAEVWADVDPLKSTPGNYVRSTDPDNKEAKVVVLKVQNDGYLGTVTRVGNFLQGVLLNKETTKYAVIRYFLQNGEWESVFQTGEEVSKIPVVDAGEVSTVIEADNLKWEIIESY